MNSVFLTRQEASLGTSNRIVNAANSQANDLFMHAPAIPHFDVSKNGKKDDLRLTDYVARRILDSENAIFHVSLGRKL